MKDRIVPHEAIVDENALPGIQEGWHRWPCSDLQYSISDLRQVDDVVCILSNAFSHVFYHWMIELYKVVILERFGFTGPYIKQDAWFSVEWLRLLGISEERIIVDVIVPTRFTKAMFTTAISHLDVSLYSNVFFALRDMLLINSPNRSCFGSRLWLDRGRLCTENREIVNSNEVFDCIRSYGFQVVDMGDLPAAAQVEAARASNVIAGPHGSGAYSQYVPERTVDCDRVLFTELGQPMCYQILSKSKPSVLSGSL